MGRIEKSIVINAPPEKVFALITDLERMPEYNDLIKEVKFTSEKRTGVGVTVHTVAEIGGRTLEVDQEITEWVENERIAWRNTSGNMTASGSWFLKPVMGGTELSQVMNYELPYSILGKIIDRLKVRKDMERGIIRENQNLKNMLEKK